METFPKLHVAVGVVRDSAGKVLIARRPVHIHQGGLWKFPGGKVEPGESVEAALRRELKEELDIDASESSPLIQIHHAYPDRRVFLDVWRVERHTGTPRGLQGQPLRWVEPGELPGYEFPAANRPIVTAARLPEHYAILEDDQGDPATLRERLHHWVATGIKLIQLRAKHLDAHQYEALADYAVAYCRTMGVVLLLNAEPEQARKLGAAGVHLSSRRLWELTHRPLDEAFWVAASCHSLEELRQAERIGADFALLSPVLPTLSHPELAPLGWKTFAAIAEHVNIPVFALGGLTPADTAIAKRHGAQGIAGIRGFLAGMRR